MFDLAAGSGTPAFRDVEQADLEALRTLFPSMVIRECGLSMDGPAPSFFDRLRQGLARGRRGEAVLVLRHESGRVWLHTKRSYPGGTYRLPSGGIEATEPALEAAGRELWEECGLRAAPADCPGILRYRLERRGVIIPFVSYVFLFEGGAHTPAARDADEGIVDFRLAWPAELCQTAQSLRGVPADWADWGRFRALVHDFVCHQYTPNSRRRSSEMPK